MFQRLTNFSPLIAVALAGLLSSCGKENAYVAPPPPEVDVQKPLVKTVTVFQDFQARTEAFETYEARARVTGFLNSIEFTDGSFVKAGDILFKIDPIEFDAAVTRAEGNRDKAVAQLTLATKNYEKRKAASASGAVSLIEVATAEAEMGIAAAELEIAKAQLLDAETELGYTEIQSKIDGWVSRTKVDKGNLVSGTEATLLATVVRDDPIYATFDVSERFILERLPKRLGENGEEKVLRLTTTDGKAHPEFGTFHSIGNEVDPNTGTIEVISQFANPDRTLAAGLSVKVGRPEAITDAVLIPRSVIQGDVGGSHVMLLGEGNKATRRNIKLSKFTIGELAVVESGINAEDKIIVNNLQRARDGIPVNPTEIPVATLSAEPAGDKPAPVETAPAGEKD